MSIEHDPQRHTWHLRTAGSSHLISLDADDELRNLHWGAPLDATDAGALAQQPPAPAGTSASFHLAGATRSPRTAGSTTSPSSNGISTGR